MTHLEIDQASLPCVQDVCQGFAVLEDGALAYSLQEQEIESHYAANIQKSQVLQRDVQIAKRLQEDERRRVGLSERLLDTEEQDSRYARAIHEEMRKREDELQMREAEDEVVAKRLQAEEELKNSRWYRHGEEEELGARLELRDLEQVLRDEEMARKLQAEEEAVAVNSEEDFRTAQVAQDEEIARFMQRRELKLQESSDTPVRRSSQRDCSDSAEGSGAPDRGEPKMGRRDSQSVSPGGKQGPATPGGIAASSRNIAEELDPTFQAPQQNGMLEVTAGSLPGQELHTGERQTVSQVCPVPPCSFYDYMEDCPETFIVPPTRRSSQKLGRLKAKDKKESCKQQ
ncbi:coiled-coil domain-containing protein 50-like isoform X3 [Polypterus senegalus]|uniref:coiled-coil domain-containing protein 50-like isoform X3 n=1 Tax=Polypterus senegalus TaxID=55291 RepID=UPI001963204F|nr:coiled-coil domain-containing protein 50-like isoform X3 [Polypterus senegalus]